jgi:hypothetical protein
MAYRESNLLKLLVTEDAYNIILFKEVVKVEFKLSDITCSRIVTKYYLKRDWADYVYVFDDDNVVCSRDKMIFQEGVLEENNIVCFYID